jgi:tRNA pseudouridine38-40 synthase
MRRVLYVEYDGTNFVGLQTQKNGRSVQQTLEQTLAQIPGTMPKVWACGRTDSGVHALAMPFHYDTQDTIPVDKVPYALNALLPSDMRVVGASQVADDFHARKQCCWREYRYRILLSRMPTALDRSRVWWIPQPLNLVPMRHACELLVGKHDFKAFAIQEERSTVREIFQTRLEVWPTDGSSQELWLGFVGSGFLRGQVRSMVGTLVEVGLGKRSSDNIQALLSSGTRSDAGPTAPPQGLYFVRAGYKPLQ